MTEVLPNGASQDHVFGFRISTWNASEVAGHIIKTRRTAADGVGLVATPNIHHIAMLRNNEAFVNAYRRAEIITCDGFPVFYYARWRGCAAPGRVTGCDIVSSIMNAPLPPWQRLFFVLDQQVTETAVQEWAARQGLSERVETFIPPMGFENDAGACREMASRIHDHGTTMLLMGVGAPKSEIFVETYRANLPPCWALCVGQAVKVELNVLTKPPKAMQTFNLEWLWRIILEPRRMTTRYFGASFGFLKAIADDLRGRPLALPPFLREVAAAGAAELPETGTDEERLSQGAFTSASGRVSETALALVEGFWKLLDLSAVTLGAVLAYWLCRMFSISVGVAGGHYWPAVLFSTMLFVGLLHVAGGYQINTTATASLRFRKMLAVWLLVQALALIEIAGMAGLSEGLVLLVLFWTTVSLVPLWRIRAAALKLSKRWRKRGALQKSVVVVGADEIGADIVERLCAHPEDYNVMGVFDDRLDRVPAALHGVKVLGRISHLTEFARTRLPDQIIVTLPVTPSSRLNNVLKTLATLPVNLRLVYQLPSGFKLRNVNYIGDHPVMDIFQRPIIGWNAVYKWLEDKLVSLILLILLAPLLLLTALAIKLESPGPCLFVQDRFGFNNKVIKVLKFRSMYAEKGDRYGTQQTARDDPRVTRVGRIIRKLSIDELPQLINVLRGDMSLVGPRAHAVAMQIGDKLYEEAVDEYAARHKVRPGITGWAQVNGLRGQVTDMKHARQRVQYDLEYIKKWSIWFDISIIWRSISLVLFQHENTY
jgi:Undecaprenyl-phosphate glucose phosphotransferase